MDKTLAIITLIAASCSILMACTLMACTPVEPPEDVPMITADTIIGEGTDEIVTEVDPSTTTVVAETTTVEEVTTTKEAAKVVGNPAVYERINNETDCTILQESFDRSYENHTRAVNATEESGSFTNAQEREWSVAYMDAADTRMEEVGCYQ